MNLTFQECCRNVIDASVTAPNQVNWAVGYAREGLRIANHCFDEQRVQALYILNNIPAWRGDTAKATRAALKKIGGVK